MASFVTLALKGEIMSDEIFPETKMGFGCMRLPLLDKADPKSIDIEQFKVMVDTFMNAGHTYFDTAFVYHEGESEVALKEALVDRYPRESFTLATKCLAPRMPNKEAAQECLDVSMKRMGVDYIDYYLLHNLGSSRTEFYDRYDLWNFVQEQKKAGRIHFVGFSLHDDSECLEKILTAHPEVDFVQLQVNYLDWEDPKNEAAKLMKVAEKHGKPVIIMEPARGGKLCNLPEQAAKILASYDPDSTQAQWAYRFCWNLPNVLTVLSGMSTAEQVRENVSSYADNKPLSEEEKTVLGKAVDAMRALAEIPCTACNYCVKECPSGVMIPETLQILNLESMTGDRQFAKFTYSWQTAAGRASSCIKCGLCEASCPQQIDIINQMEIAAEKYE